MFDLNVLCLSFIVKIFNKLSPLPEGELRVKIEALSIKSTVKDAMDFYLSHTHSRIPIY